MGDFFETLGKQSPKVLGFTVAALVLAIWWVYSKLSGRKPEEGPADPLDRPRRRVPVVLEDPTESTPEEASPNELAEYDRLLSRFPDEPGLLYNRAAALAEAGRDQEACTSFLALLDQILPKPDLNPGHHSVNPLAGILSGSREPPPLPELVLDVEAFLARLEPRRKDDVPLLHGLASLSSLQDRHDEALGLYERIIAIDPGDEIAKLYVRLLGTDASDE